MTIFIFLGLIVLIALLSAFLILFIDKIGVRDNIISRSPKLVSKLFSCDFCLSFWVAFVFMVPVGLCCMSLGLYSVAFETVLVPFFSAPITRILI